MWWDLLGGSGQADDPTTPLRAQACLEVMRRTLELDADACRESALHGLGHWHAEYPSEVEAIIAQFLEQQDSLRPALRAYALAAQAGCVQ
jgi:hypothetical protein